MTTAAARSDDRRISAVFVGILAVAAVAGCLAAAVWLSPGDRRTRA